MERNQDHTKILGKEGWSTVNHRAKFTCIVLSECNYLYKMVAIIWGIFLLKMEADLYDI